MLSEDKLAQIEFKGSLRFLSNMYPCQISIEKASVSPFPKHLKPYWMFNNELFKSNFISSEHLYQACKADDIAWAELVLNAEKPEKTKVLARRLIGSTFELREEFHEQKLELMKWAVTEKFHQNPDLMSMLKSTGDMELVERNYWGDTFWGECQGRGANHLGKILMQIRKEA